MQNTLRHIIRLSFCMTAAVNLSSERLPANEGKQTVEIGSIRFTVGSEFELTQVAGEPLTQWPMIADWDPEGNLLLVESGV